MAEQKNANPLGAETTYRLSVNRSIDRIVGQDPPKYDNTYNDTCAIIEIDEIAHAALYESRMSQSQTMRKVYIIIEKLTLFLSTKKLKQ